MNAAPDLIDAMLIIIRNPSIDDAAARLAATVISVDANFNARVAVCKKQGVEREDLYHLLDFSEETLCVARDVAAAVRHGISNQELINRLEALQNKIANYHI